MSIFNMFKSKKNPDSNMKKVYYETFEISKYKHNYVLFESVGFSNDEYDLGKNAIINECLADEKIYRYGYGKIKADIKDNDNGYDVIVESTVIGTILPDIADKLDIFLDSNKETELYVSIEGGAYKYYDSTEDKIITGNDKLKATLYVKYYK